MNIQPTGMPLPGPGAAAAVTPSPAAAPVAGPQDVATVAAPPPPPARPLWEEASRRGLLQAGSTVSGPLGQVLSQQSQRELGQVVEGLAKSLQFSEKRDFALPWQDKFTPLNGRTLTDRVLGAQPGNFGLKLYVVGQDVGWATVDSLADLQALDAFYQSGDLAHLADSHLARAIHNIGAHGDDFIRPNERYYGDFHYRDATEVHKLGQYGAYKALMQPGGTNAAGEQALLAGRLGEDAVELPSPLDAEGLAYFQMSGDIGNLEKGSLAQSVRDLVQQGYTFHTPGGIDLKPQQVWATFVKDGKAEVSIGVGGIGVQKIGEEVLLDPTRLSPDVATLKRLYDATLKPSIDNKTVNDYDARKMVSACAKGIPGLTVEQCWTLIDDMRQAEAKHGESQSALGRAVQDFDFLQLQTASDDDKAAAVGLFKRLLGSMDAEASRSVFTYLRGDLKLESFNPQEYAQEEKRFLELSTLLGGFGHARDARELLGFETGQESFDQKLEVLRQLADLEKKYAPPPAPDPEDEDRPRHRRDAKPVVEPGRQALNDFKLLLGYRLPGQSLEQAAGTLETLEAAILPREGWKAGRDTFVFIQKGLQYDALCGRTADQAVKEMLESYLLTGKLAPARQALLSPPPSKDDPKHVKRDDQDVDIGGVKVPVNDART